MPTFFCLICKTNSFISDTAIGSIPASGSSNNKKMAEMPML